MKTEDLFHKACEAIGKNFLELGFKATKKGQELKKSTADKDLVWRISFESSTKNTKDHVSLRVFIGVSSKKLEASVGHTSVLGYQLSYLAKDPKWETWNLAENFDACIKQVTELLEQLALPVFTHFVNEKTALQFLSSQGTRFFPYMKNDNLVPIQYILSQGSKKQAQDFLDLYMKDCSYAERICDYVKFLESGKTPPLEKSGFSGAHLVKSVFAQGLKFRRM